MCVCVCGHMCEWGQKRASEPLGLKLQAAINCPMWMLGTELRTTERASSTCSKPLSHVLDGEIKTTTATKWEDDKKKKKTTRYNLWIINTQLSLPAVAHTRTSHQQSDMEAGGVHRAHSFTSELLTTRASGRGEITVLSCVPKPPRLQQITPNPWSHKMAWAN